MKIRNVTVTILGALLTLTVLAACGSDPEPSAARDNQKADPAIHDSLPAKIKKKGSMTVVMNGANLPWWEEKPGKTGEYKGAGAELMTAVAEVMGVKVEFVAIPDISGAVAAIASERYAFAFAPYGDSVGKPDARPGVEFVDVVQENVPFLVKKGNPEKVQSLDTVCGIKLAAQVNGGAYELAVAQAKKCKAKGDDLTIVGVTGPPNGVLAVRSGRADAFFSSGAALYYAAEQSKGQLEIAGENSPNGFEGLFQGAVLPKDSPMTQPLLKSFQKLFASGEYQRIMKKWDLDKEIVDEPGINMYSTWLAEREKS
jgi:polar amino acid transport system substrate-binding protein